MQELSNKTTLLTTKLFWDYYDLFPKTSNAPFANLGMAYIAFAREEKHLFRLLFLTELAGKKSLYEVLNGDKGNVLVEINKAAASGCKDPQGMFMRMWLFIHGAACMSLTGDYDLSDAETKQLLEQEYANG